MPVTPTMNQPKNKPPRSDHVVIYGLMGNTYIAMGMDPITKGIHTIEYPHHEVHEGNMFTTGYKTPEDAQLADDGVIDILLRTSVTYCHLIGSINSSGDGEVFFYEDCTITGAAFGTALGGRSMNRARLGTPLMVASEGPTVATVGTLMSPQWLIGGTKNQAFGGSIREGTEWVLDASKYYLLRFQNRRGSASNVGLTLQWYEKGNY